MKLRHQLLETAAVLVGGIFAFFYFMWKFGKDVFMTTGARVVEIRRN